MLRWFLDGAEETGFMHCSNQRAVTVYYCEHSIQAAGSDPCSVSSHMVYNACHGILSDRIRHEDLSK